MAGQDGRAAGREEAVAVVEPGDELVDAEDAHPDGRELDGEGQAVEAAAEAGHGGPVVGGEFEAGGDGGGPVGEERQGRVGRGGREVRVRVGHRQRPYVQEVFLREGQPVAARREDPDAGRAVQQSRRQLRAGGQQMLAVVEDQEQSAVPQLLDQRVQGRLFGVVVQAERVGRGERDERRVVQAGEVCEADAVGERPLDAGGDPPGQPRLADAAGSGQRDQSCGGQQPPPLGQFVPPVDEAGRLDRWLVDPSRR